MSNCPRDLLREQLRAIGACEPALQWLSSQPADTTLQMAWETCPDWTWLRWLKVSCDDGYRLPEGAACAASFRIVNKCPEKIPEECIGGCGYAPNQCDCYDVFDDDWDDEDEDEEDEEDEEDD